MIAKVQQVRFDIHGLPKIDSIYDLAGHTGYPVWQLWNMQFKADDFYRCFDIPKKSGGTRTICVSSPPLKSVQRWVLRSILNRLQTSDHCYGFYPGAKLRDHVLQHQSAKAVLTLDIADFFGSISTPRIRSVFTLAGYSSISALMLSRLCSYRDTLPQGAPSSPRIANLVCWRMDQRLAGLADHLHLVYTRYADDLTFSSHSLQVLHKALGMIIHIIRDSGFAVNQQKTRIGGPGRALRVTGLTVYSEGVGIGRRRLRTLRAQIHRLHWGKDADDIAHIQGWLDYVSDVDPKRYAILVRYIDCLKGASSDSKLHQLRVKGELKTSINDASDLENFE
jgi:RNA-directed DNA polymerase